MEAVKSWLDISRERLTGNYAVLVREAGSDMTLLPVIKANAYGHGATVCAPMLAGAGAPWLGVTDAAEGEAVLRSLAGMATVPKVLLMSGLLPEDAEGIVAQGLVPVVWDRQHVEWLREAAIRRAAGHEAAGQGGKAVAVHLEIDTGMCRQGIAPGVELDGLLAWFRAHPQLELDGVFTHFASAEVLGSEQTRVQRERFEQAVAAVARCGLRPAWVHAGNSSMVDTEPEDENLSWLRSQAARLSARAMVRTGIALYGYCLPMEAAERGGAGGRDADGQGAVARELRPVMTWKTRVLSVREIPAGAAIGYNGAFVAERPMRLALLPVGYADGLRRELSGTNTKAGGWATVHGRRAAIVGRISMNLTTLDVTGVAEVKAGDAVTLLGDGITAADHARMAGTIPYEILCGVRGAVGVRTRG